MTGPMASTVRERFALRIRPAVFLGRNPLTFGGAVLTTSAAFTLLVFWAFLIVKRGPIHPYTGIVFYLILPGIFVTGLALIPIGILWRRWRLRRTGRVPVAYPRIDLRDPAFRHILGVAAVATFLNVIIVGTATYQAVGYMDTSQFCGQTCHTVMAPEFTSYRGSPHARVECVACHIGSGASWFVRAKLSGVRQVFAVTFGTYSRPIPTPIEHLRPARDTCEACHWPEKFHGDKFLVRRTYDEDEANTPLATVLVLKVGGRTWQGTVGIHGRHLDEKERISYVSTDGRRQVISAVTYVDDDGKKVEYVSSDAKLTPEQLAQGERRVMDCMDCHNRPTHTLRMPGQAVDEAFTAGELERSLPFLKRQALEILQASYASQAEAAAQIPVRLRDFYSSRYKELFDKRRSAVESSAAALVRIYNSNVFPDMNIFWGTYPNNIGHELFPGCFRCHDGSHKSADGREISSDCETCHRLLALQDPDPDILKQLAGE